MTSGKLNCNYCTYAQLDTNLRLFMVTSWMKMMTLNEESYIAWKHINLIKTN